MNLLEETEIDMATAGKTWNDVARIGSRAMPIGFKTIEHFKKVAAERNYNDGYGTAEIPEDLVIIFHDGTWLERWEYDGSEGWSYVTPPELFTDRSHIEGLGYQNLRPLYEMGQI